MSLFVLLVSSTVVLVLTPWIQRWGLHLGVIDQPDVRKLHQQPVVRFGGVAICLGTLLAWWVVGWNFAMGASLPPLLVTMTLGGLGFFAIGLLDDLASLSPFVRLGMQAGVSTLVWSMGLRLETLPFPGLTESLPPWLSLPVTCLWLAGMVNAINWLDGMDGLAAGTVAVAIATFALFNQTEPSSISLLLAVGLLGSLLGFLRYNAAPAQIFMGDGGSYFIGFVVAGLATTLRPEVPAMTAAWVPFGLLAVPILDMVFVIVSRLRARKSPFFPDRRHLHHRLLQMGVPHAAVVWCVYGLTLLFGLATWLTCHHPVGWVVTAAALGLLYLTVRLAAIREALPSGITPVTPPDIQPISIG